MATTTSGTLGELLKQLYAPWDIEQLLNLTHPVCEELAAKGSAQLGGGGFNFAVRNRSAEGHGFIGEGDDLPASGSTEVLQATVEPKVQVGAVELTGLARSLSSGNPMAFARAFEEQIGQTLEGMMADKEAALFGDGSGTLTSFTSADPATSAGPHACVDVGNLREGMSVLFYDSNGANQRSATPSVIKEIDWVAKTVTFDAAIVAAVAASDRIVKATPTQIASASQITTVVPEGLESSLKSSGEYLGINRATYPNFKGLNMTASSLFTEEIFTRARTRVTQEGGVSMSAMGDTFRCATHPNQLDQLFKLAIPRVRYSGGGPFDLGYNEGAITFGGVTFATSYLCPTDTAYIGDFSKSCTLYAPNGELHVDTDYNGSSMKWVDRKDVGLVFAKAYYNFAVKNPQRFVRITALTEQTR